MPHTATRHGRQIRVTGNRRALHVETLHRGEGAYLARGVIRWTAAGWQPATYDGVWLDEVPGDYVDAERALLDATAELDDHLTVKAAADAAAWRLITTGTLAEAIWNDLNPDDED